MSWPPRIGDSLPRAADAWSEPHKRSGWILVARGHGLEWATVMHVGLDEVELVWEAIAAAVLLEPISKVVDPRLVSAYPRL